MPFLFTQFIMDDRCNQASIPGNRGQLVPGHLQISRPTHCITALQLKLCTGCPAHRVTSAPFAVPNAMQVHSCYTVLHRAKTEKALNCPLGMHPLTECFPPMIGRTLRCLQCTVISALESVTRARRPWFTCTVLHAVGPQRPL